MDIFNHYIENSFAAYPENRLPYQAFDVLLQMADDLPTGTIKDHSGKIHGFGIVDTASPDFTLLLKNFKKTSPTAKFKTNWEERLEKHKKGLTIIRADQCPYSVKNVNEICETAQKEFRIKPNVISLNNSKEAQNSPCPFGTFCIVFNGKIVAWYPISNGRFRNIMNKIKG